MQFLTIVVVPDETSDVVAAVTGLMEPYNVERPVAARKEYVPREEVDYLLEVYGPYGLKRDDVDAVVTQLEEDMGFIVARREDPWLEPWGGNAARRQALPTTGHQTTRCAIRTLYRRACGKVRVWRWLRATTGPCTTLLAR